MINKITMELAIEIIKREIAQKELAQTHNHVRHNHLRKDEIQSEIDSLKKALESLTEKEMKWIEASKTLPPVDVGDKWNNEHKISKDILTYSKTWGKRFGRYFHNAGFWSVDGVTSSNGVEVEFWMDVEDPKTN